MQQKVRALCHSVIEISHRRPLVYVDVPTRDITHLLAGNISDSFSHYLTTVSQIAITQYNIPVTVIMGQNMDSIVVDDEQVGMECIK